MLLSTMLSDAGLPLDDAVLLRHARRPAYHLWRNDRSAFERYQAMQLTPRATLLKRAHFWVSFVANEGSETIFLGVYEARDPTQARPRPEDISAGIAADAIHDLFHTRLLPHLGWLRGRMKIRWSGGEINWVQRALGIPKEVLTMTALPPQDDGGDAGRLHVAQPSADDESVFEGFIGDAPPLMEWNPREQSSWTAPSRPIDAISWMIRIERRSGAHEQLLKRVAAKAVGRTLESSRLVDLVVDRDVLIEVKSLEDDPVTQVRAALAQLYHYRFVYRDELPAPKLLAVFGARPSGGKDDLVRFLDGCAIGVAWPKSDGFDGTSTARAVAPWLFE